MGTWDPTKPPGLAQQAPLTEEYRAVYAANMAKAKAGLEYDPKATCGPLGMPRLMSMYEPMEMIIRPNVIYMLFESQNPIRRIYTDGRTWPEDTEPSFAGFSIGRWSDSKGDGKADSKYDTLEIETRNIGKGPRLYDGSGTPLAYDNKTVVKEKLYLDKANPDIMHNQITTIDSALTRPWTVSRFYKRDRSPPQEFICTENDRWVIVAGRVYMTDADGYFMPTRQDQPPPDPKYFEKHFKPAQK